MYIFTHTLLNNIYRYQLDMTLTSLRETTIQRDKYVEYGHKVSSALMFIIMTFIINISLHQLKSKCIEYREELKNLLEEMADNEVCMYVCMYVRMYVCMHVFFMYIIKYILEI